MSTIEKRIRAVRGNLSRNNLGRLIDKTARTIERWEVNFTGGDGDLLLMAQRMGCNYQWLKTGEGDMYSDQKNPPGEKDVLRKHGRHSDEIELMRKNAELSIQVRELQSQVERLEQIILKSMGSGSPLPTEPPVPTGTEGNSRMWLVASSVLVVLFLVMLFGIDGQKTNPYDTAVFQGWVPNGRYELGLVDNALHVRGLQAAGYQNFRKAIPVTDFREATTLSLEARSGLDVDVRVDLCDALGHCTNATPVVHQVPGTDQWQTYAFDFAGRFRQSWDDRGEHTPERVDPAAITEIVVFVNPGRSFTGEIQLRLLGFDRSDYLHKAGLMK